LGRSHKSNHTHAQREVETDIYLRTLHTLHTSDIVVDTSCGAWHDLVVVMNFVVPRLSGH